jgi:GTP cyclohydrolase IA
MSIDAENVVELRSEREQAPLRLAPREITPTDWERYEENIAEILEAFGMPPGTPGTVATPERFLRALYEATSGYDGDPKLLTAFPSEASGAPDAIAGQIVEGPIAFSALCEHHALPFHGSAHIGYIAGDRIIGISKLTRLVRLFARRFTVQERLGEEIAGTLMHLIEPEGVAVHLEASHLCTLMRGVEEHSRTTTTFWRGAYRDSELRREFLGEVRARSPR